MNDTPQPAVTKPAPYFDPQALRVELTAIYNAHDGVPEAAKPEVVERLKALLAHARAAARAGLEADGNGRRCAEGLSRFEDELIELIYDYTVTHVYRATNPSDAERMAVVATGGYGRGMLAPGSDIDLLFLLPYKQTPWGESVIEHVLHILWDLGQKVGHAVRTVDQCIRLSEADMTIRTSILDSRQIFGDRGLFDELEQRFRKEVVSGTIKAFVDAKMAEREERHRKSGASRYRVEPNIKDGKGGLRDLHTLHWLVKYLHGETSARGDPQGKVFTREEFHTFRRCEDFLWTVRCHLHFLAGRAEERLSFDVQPVLAERLHYADRADLRAVERFMKHYFLIAKEVGDLTAVLCASLEVQQLKTLPSINDFFNPLTWRTRRRLRNTSDFKIDNGRLNIVNPDSFKNDPVNLMRLFMHTERMGVFLHPNAQRRLRTSLHLIDDALRNDPEANRIFLSLLTGKDHPETALRWMNEAGVLGRFIPEFGKVVSMMQFNMYHHYTVDEHLIRTVGEIATIERGEVGDAHPLSTKIFSTLENRRVLYVAAFLHDIGKGRAEDHSIVGARIARRLCPRLGLTAEETELCAWLVEQHLTMSNIAQSRDLSDPKTIEDFAAIVETPERLKLLIILTVADIKAVGPGTWNGWKGQLLRTLYYETEPLLSGRGGGVGDSKRIDAAQAALRASLADLPPAGVSKFIERQYPDYWLKIEPRKQVDHARMVVRAESAGLTLATDVKTDAFTAVTELSVLAPNHPRLLSLFAGACAASDANIVGAQIATTRDGLAIDTFLLQRAFDHDEDEERRARRIGQTIEKLLKGETWLAAIMGKKRHVVSKISAFTVDPEVTIDNDLSEQFTVIEVSGLDRPGLLYEVTAALSDLNLDINSAHITTFGEKAVDVFYVTDLTGKKITSDSRKRSIREALVKVLASQEAAA